MDKSVYKGARLETIRIFFRYLPLILSIVVLATGISALTSFTKADFYEGHVQLMITPNDDRVELVRSTRYQTRVGLRELLHTEKEYITSWPLVEVSAKQADSTWRTVLESSTPEHSLLMNMLQSKLWVSPVRNSTMIRIGFNDVDPERLTLFLNSLAENYKRARTIIEPDTSSIRYYEDKTSNINQQLDSLQALRTEILNVNDLVSPELEMPTHLRRSDQIANEMLSLDRQIDEQTALLVRIENALEYFIHEEVLVLPLPPNSPLQPLKTLYYEKQRELNALQQKYHDDYFEIVRLKEELALLKSQITSEIRGIRDAELITKQNLLEQRQRNATINRQLTAILGAYPNIVAILEQIEMEIESRRKMLGILTDKLSEYQLANPSFDANVDVTIVEPAVLPSYPAGPRRTLSVVITFMLSLVVSILIAFLMDLLSNRYNSTYQLALDLNLPVIVSIPERQD